MTPIEIACNHQNADLTNCGSDRYEPCVWQEHTHGEFHAERIALAGMVELGGEGDRLDAKAFDDAVERSGII